MTGLSTPACAAVGLSVIHQGEQRAEVKLSVQSIESFCCSHSLCFSCCILSLIGFSPIPGRSTNVVEILEDCTGARLQWLKLPLSKPAQSLFRKLSKIYQLAGKKKKKWSHQELESWWRAKWSSNMRKHLLACLYRCTCPKNVFCD